VSQATGTSPPPLTTTAGGNEETSHQKLKKKKKHFAPMVTAYKGKCEELKGHVYYVVPGMNGFDTSAKTTTEIRQYIAHTVDPQDLGMYYYQDHDEQHRLQHTRTRTWLWPWTWRLLFAWFPRTSTRSR
jgi:hypothetical protein